MGLPQSLKILSCPYSINYVEEDTLGKGISGDLDGDNIRVYKGFSPQRTVEVILHETIHAMLQSQGIPTKLEERITSVLSESFTQFLIDNPTFILYAMGVLAPKG